MDPCPVISSLYVYYFNDNKLSTKIHPLLHCTQYSFAFVCILAAQEGTSKASEGKFIKK